MLTERNRILFPELRVNTAFDSREPCYPPARDESEWPRGAKNRVICFRLSPFGGRRHGGEVQVGAETGREPRRSATRSASARPFAPKPSNCSGVHQQQTRPFDGRYRLARHDYRLAAS